MDEVEDKDGKGIIGGMIVGMMKEKEIEMDEKKKLYEVKNMEGKEMKERMKEGMKFKYMMIIV